MPRNPEQEKKVLEWITQVLGEPVPEGDFTDVSIYFYNISTPIITFAAMSMTNDADKTIRLYILSICLQVLKNGVVLCKLMNKISPGAIKKFKEKGPNFLLMENVQAFLVSQ